MTTDLFALMAHAGEVDSGTRATLAEVVAETRPTGSVLVSTCHRVELYGPPTELSSIAADTAWSTARMRAGEAVAWHLVRLAVGRSSAVVGEDQVLHQLRGAVHEARMRGPVMPQVDRLFDMALRAGRIARSWLPPRRDNLAELALSRVLDGRAPGRVLVVGAGEMGRLGASAVRTRGGQPVITSRTFGRAAVLADQLGVEATEFLPGRDEISRLDGIVVALAGRWSLPAEGRLAVAESGVWLIDLSSPPALDHDLRAALGSRLITIDDLATQETTGSPRVLARLDALAEQTVADYIRWAARTDQRGAARALRERAASVESIELGNLWRRMPNLDPAERSAIARAFERLSEGLLREPLERLGEDGDGRHARAAQELFRL